VLRGYKSQESDVYWIWLKNLATEGSEDQNYSCTRLCLNRHHHKEGKYAIVGEPNPNFYPLIKRQRPSLKISTLALRYTIATP
jgi:hypothetical protein